VDLFVPEALIPNLIGQPLAKAIDVLRSRGMRLGNITVIDSTGAVVPGAARGGLVSGLVVKQNPPPDRPASAQQVVDLVVRIP
jgi:beta-lactam-binding protein with PASTA domain